MSQPITCLHLADLHFGVEAYGFTNHETGLNTRLEDFSRSLMQAVDYAIDWPVDLALFAGDAYKRNSPSPTEQRELVKHFCRLADAGIPVVMISGNHDIPVIAGKATSIDIFRTVRPNRFYVFSNRPTLEPPIIETGKGPIAVACLPYISVSHLRNIPAYREKKGEDLRNAYEEFYHSVLTGMAEAVPREIPRVLLAHLTVHGAQFGGYRGSVLMTDEIRILSSALATAGYDYVALGHVHRHQNLTTRSEIPVVYPGSIDRVDFGEAEEEKGFVIANVHRGGAEYEFKPVEVREFVSIKVETEKGDDITQRIVNAIQTESDRLPDSVVRVTYVADDEEIHKIDMKRIHEALQPVHFKAGFIRIPRDMAGKRRTTSLSTNTALTDALSAYIREHSEIHTHGEVLIQKAKEIEQSIFLKSPDQ